MGQRGKNHKHCFRTVSEAAFSPIDILCFIAMLSSKEERGQNPK